ncbi:MAG: hemerythrin domain-containing protein [Phycisphaerae bacterium]|nr:hemerythrin domain-containing protein [Phycisphaerae bacterium]
MDRKNWLDASEIELVEHIEKQHRQMTEKFLNAQTLLTVAIEQHNDQFSDILGPLQEFVPEFKTKMEAHFGSEEKVLLPYIRQMDNFNKGKGEKPVFHTGSIKNPISRMEYEHDLTETVMFNKIHSITGDYNLPPDSSDALKTLYDGLKDIEKNLSEHIHLEHNVLFPLAIELELQLMHKK